MLDATSMATQGNVPVEFKGVDFSIDKKQLIRNISCKLDQADITVVMGANGAGKSLFLRLIAGLLKPDNGQIFINANNPMPNNPKIEHDTCVSMVFQNPVLLRRSAFDNLAYVLNLQKLSKEAIKNKVQNALVDARLEKHASTPARRLSGGEQQRLAMARALVVEPDILLLDEATANLDPASTFIVEKMVDEASNKGTTIIFVTHDVRQAKRIGDKVLFLHEGQMLAHKPAREFFRAPGSHEAQAYLDGRVPDQKIQE